MTKLRKVLSLSSQDRRILLEATIRLACFKLRLPLLDFRVDRSVRTNGVERAQPDHQTERALRIARLVAAAAAHCPVKVACLHRSLVLWSLLQRRGIPCEIRLGASKENGKFASHAWVVHRGMPLIDHESRLSFYRVLNRAVVPVNRSLRTSRGRCAPPLSPRS